MATGTQPVSITNKNTGAVLYTATVRRDTSVYPLTAAGAAAFATAIGAGEHALVAFNGAVIPAGNFPPATVPPAQPVSWITGLRYSYAANNLFVEGAGEAMSLMVEAASGVSLLGTDDQGYTVRSGVFYGYIPNAGQGDFDKAWRFNKLVDGTAGLPVAPLKLTVKRNSTGVTSVYLLIPVEGADRLTLLNSTILGDDITLTEIEVDSTQFVDGQDAGGFAPPPPANQTTTTSTVATPITTTTTEQCSGNSTEKRSFTLTSPAAATNVALKVMAKATEGASVLLVQVNQQPAVSVPLPQGTVYVEVTMPPVDLINGANTILIWSGSTYLCVNKISATVQAPPAQPAPSPAPAASTSPQTYARVLFAGNSITKHPGTGATTGPFVVDASNPARGMAASVPDKDYVHLLTARLRVGSPSVVGKTFGDWNIGGGLDIASGPFMEQQLTLPGTNFMDEVNGTRFLPVINEFKPDLLIFSLGENVADGSLPADPAQQGEFVSRIKAFIDRLISGNPSCKVVLRTAVWDRPRYDSVIRKVAADRNYPVADMSDTWTNRNTNGYYINPNGTAIEQHPSDLGMARISDSFFGVIPGASASAPASPPPISSGTGTGGYRSSAFVAPADQGWAGENMKFIQSGNIKAGFKRSVGASLCWLSYVNGGADDNFVNDNAPDLGRQVQFGSDYQKPSNSYLTKAGTNTNAYGFDTGRNGVQGGSLSPYFTSSPVLASAVYTHPTRGLEFYAKVQPKIWGVPNADNTIILETWISFVPRGLYYFTRHTQTEQNTPGNFEAVLQENPSMYLVANMYQHYCAMTKGGPLVYRTHPNATTLNGGGGVHEPVVYTAENWFGGFRPTDGQGVTNYCPRNSMFGGAQFNGVTGHWSSNYATYVNNYNPRNYNNVGTYEDDGYILLGTKDEVKSTIATLEPVDQSFDFDFSKMNLFGGYVELINGQFVWAMGKPHIDGATSYLEATVSPARAWDASTFTQVNFELTISGGGTSVGLKFMKPGEVGALGTEFRKSFPIQGDGIKRVYTVSTADPNWNGIISQVGMQADAGTAPNSTCILHRIWKN